jgi:phage terminase large subunit
LYKWREDRHGNTLDEPIGLHDHALDALRYAVEPLRLQAGGMKAGKIQLWR